jgi:hypothetical protein
MTCDPPWRIQCEWTITDTQLVVAFDSLFNDFFQVDKYIIEDTDQRCVDAGITDNCTLTVELKKDTVAAAGK